MELSKYLAKRGAQSDLARKLEVSPVLVHQWLTIREVPIERCYPIEVATDGQVTRKDLRPDDWDQIWPELRDENRLSPDRRFNRRSKKK